MCYHPSFKTIIIYYITLSERTTLSIYNVGSVECREGGPHVEEDAGQMVKYEGLEIRL